MNRLPSIETAHNMFVCEERHLVVSWNQEAWAEAIAFPARVPYKSGFDCIICNKSGHSYLECF